MTEDQQSARLGAVFAGGRARRFGRDKALAELGGRTLLAHAVAALSRHVGEVVVCGRAVAGLRALADRPRPDMGPLGALNAALHDADARGFAGVLTTGCDMPFFPDAAAAALTGDDAAVLPGQHLAGYWPVRYAAMLDAHLADAQDLSLAAWFGRAQPRVVVVDALDMPNVNTPDDLARLIARD